jgi:hypothetical protein
MVAGVGKYFVCTKSRVNLTKLMVVKQKPLGCRAPDGKDEN